MENGYDAYAHKNSRGGGAWTRGLIAAVTAGCMVVVCLIGTLPAFAVPAYSDDVTAATSGTSGSSATSGSDGATVIDDSDAPVTDASDADPSTNTVATRSSDEEDYGLADCSDNDYNLYLNCRRPSSTVDDDIFAKHVVKDDVSNPSGTTVNLFDYWLYRQDAADPVYVNATETVPDSGWKAKTDDGELAVDGYQNRGINLGRQLRFRRVAHQEANFNRYTGNACAGDGGTTGGGGKCTGYYSGAKPMQRMVQRTLGSDGFPVLWASADSSKTTIPGFVGAPPATGITAADSLSYLFDLENAANGKQSYANVRGLFQLQNGYYSYDSQKNFAAYNEKTNSFALYDTPAVNPSFKTGLGMFFPFNTAGDVYQSVNGTPAENNGKLVTSTSAIGPAMNHYFGLSMSSRFQQTTDGKASDGKDVVFSFSGDDDAWVYIDGVLVGDLGGIHDAVSLHIDFSTGVVTVSTQSGEVVQRTTLRELYRAAGREDSVQWGTGAQSDTFAGDTNHTLKFYYLERGNLDSNMSLNFNLVPIKESDILKIDQSGKPIAGVGFKLYKARKDYTYDGERDLLAAGVTDENGQLMLERTKADGSVDPIVFDDLYKENPDNTHYVLEETDAPAGYRTLTDTIQLEYHPATAPGFKGYLVSTTDSAYRTGAFANPSLLVTAPDDVYPLNADNTAKDTTWLSGQFDGKYQDGDIREALNDGKGVMFAVIMAYTGETTTDNDQAKQLLADTGNWKTVTGNSVSGWNTAEIRSVSDVIAAARKQPVRFSLKSSGAYSADIEELPGSAETYYNLLQDGEKYRTRFTVAYYYTSANDLNKAEAGNTRRLYMGDTDAGTGVSRDDVFTRQFAVNVHVPNVRNELVVRKVDENGDPIYRKGEAGTSATFSLYSADSDCAKASMNDGAKPAYAALAECTPVDSVATGELDVTATGTGGNRLTLASAAKFPSAGHTLTNGTYWLIESKSPERYEASTDVTKVIVNNTGVYADAGTDKDDVTVLQGVGSVLPTMSQFAAVDDLDRTLSDITAQVKTSTSEPGITGSVDWEVNESLGKLYLTYGVLNDGGQSVPYIYGPLRGEGDTTPVTARSVMIAVDSGWSDMIISQLYEGTVTVNGKEITVERDLKRDRTDATLKMTGALTNLYTGSVVVQVADTPTPATATAAVRKTVNGTDAQWPDGTTFRFRLEAQTSDTARASDAPLPTGGAGTDGSPADTCVRDTASAASNSDTGTGSGSCTVTLKKPADDGDGNPVLTDSATLGTFTFDWDAVKGVAADENGTRTVTYGYVIRELGTDGNPGSGGMKDLVRYSQAKYRLDIIVTYRAGDGLKASAMMTRLTKDDGTSLGADGEKVDADTDDPWKGVHVADFTNTHVVKVSSLPLTGDGMTARDWILRGLAFAAVAGLVGAGIRTYRKRKERTL